MNTPMEELISVMRKLRSPEGCPWDREQTHKSIKKCSMEECAELMDAIEDSDDAGMREELGDLLMHIVLHSVIAEERGAFSFDDVVNEETEKMIRRHPHVFGSEHVESSSEVQGLWDRVKKTEKGHDRPSVLDGIPYHCPAILQAEKIQKKASKTGFDWDSPEQILDKIQEELNEVREAMASGNEEHTDEELGDLFFAVSNLSRFRKRRSGEELLAAASKKFALRFRFVEAEMKKKGIPMTHDNLAEMEILWNLAKNNEKMKTSRN